MIARVTQTIKGNNSLRSKRFQSSYCAKVRAGAKKKKNGRGRGRGEEETSFPSPSPVTPFFLLSSQLPRRTRAATLATQARAITDVPGDIMCGSHHNSYFFILLRLSEWRSTTTLFLLDLPARSRSMYF